MPTALYALTVSAFGISVTEFIIMGLLIEVGDDLGAWTGGLAIDHGPGLAAVPLAATAFPLPALLLSAVALKAERHSAPAIRT